MAVASVAGLTNNMLIVLPITVVAAVILLKSGQNRKIKGDAAVAMISVGALAIGYLIMNMFSASSNVAGDVCGTLFGSVAILTLTKLDVWLCIAMSGIVILFFLLFKNRLFAVSFDENFARTTGTRVELFNLVVAVLTAMIIVLAMKLVGSLLVSALIIFPALSSMRLFKTFNSVIISSAVISLICAVFGILAAVIFSTPVGSTVVMANIIVFLMSFAVAEIFLKKV
jgi:zinc transport system permease protein